MGDFSLGFFANFGSSWEKKAPRTTAESRAYTEGRKGRAKCLIGKENISGRGS
jgi:hypothetical protein